MPQPILVLDSVTKRFAETIAVDDLSLSIPEGEYFCILGPSGCGKTTLLRLIAGFEKADKGSLQLAGRDLRGVPPEKRDVNIVFQSYALFPHMSVFENVAFGLRARRESNAVITERVQEALRLVRLEGERNRLPRQLSGGQQQRVALARALVMQPRVLLLDEPMSALDRHLRQAMQDELRRLHSETGLTFIHITHDQAEALALGQRIAVMRAGRFAQIGTPQELYRRPRNRFIAEFVGASNVLDGVVSTPNRIDVDGIQLETASSVPRPGAPVLINIRPEAFHLDSTGFEARIQDIAFAGAFFDVTLMAGAVRMLARVPAREAARPLEAGQLVNVQVDPADVVILDGDV